ncbi:MAG: hopanoid biosynthesis-associated protein HpnK [Rhodospirillales bacterium]
MQDERILITVADDFGLSPLVNEAVEHAALRGVLRCASLMVAAPAAADAIARARVLGGRLAVGLHLVVIEGPAVLPPEKIPDLVDARGEFPSDQVAMGFRYAFNPKVRRQLAAEIRAQFEAFRATGLPLDHANAHKHMHLHPYVGRMLIEIGREYGLHAVRIPAEPPAPGVRRSLGDRALYAWTGLLRRQARRAGMLTNDAILGLGSSGHLTPMLVQGLVQRLPAGVTELYFHPATGEDAILRRHMPTYEHRAEFAALLQTRLPADVRLVSYGELGR